MPFWTVEDAGPYKEKSNFLMRTTLMPVVFWRRWPIAYQFTTSHSAGFSIKDRIILLPSPRAPLALRRALL